MKPTVPQQHKDPSSVSSTLCFCEAQTPTMCWRRHGPVGWYVLFAVRVGGGVDMGQDLGYFCVRGLYSCRVVSHTQHCEVFVDLFILFWKLPCPVGCFCPVRFCSSRSLRGVTPPRFHRIRTFVRVMLLVCLSIWYKMSGQRRRLRYCY